MKKVTIKVPGGIGNIGDSTLTKLINSPDSISFRKNPNTTTNQICKYVSVYLTFHRMQNYNAGYFKTSYGKTS